MSRCLHGFDQPARHKRHDVVLSDVARRVSFHDVIGRGVCMKLHSRQIVGGVVVVVVRVSVRLAATNCNSKMSVTLPRCLGDLGRGCSWLSGSCRGQRRKRRSLGLDVPAQLSDSLAWRTLA